MDKMRKPVSERAFEMINALLLILLTAAFILPFVVVISSSLMSDTEAARLGSYVIFAPNPDFSAYEAVLGAGSLLYNAYGVTLLRILVGTFLNLLFTSMLAYGLVKKSVPGRNVFMMLIFFTMFFSGGLIPYFLLIRHIGLYDTFWVMVIPGLISPWNMILMRNFFMQVPASLEESAELDGATPLRTLIHIILPVSAPIMATMALFYGVAHWNSWFDAMMFVNDNKLWPIQLLLRNLIFSSSAASQLDVNAMMVNKPPSTAIKCAVIVVSTLPIMFVYPFLQKYFARGILVGSIKG